MKRFTRLAAVSVFSLVVTLSFAPPALAAVYQWELSDPSDPNSARQKSNTLCTDGADVIAAPFKIIDGKDLSYAYLANDNLKCTTFRDCLLLDAEMSGINLEYGGFLNSDISGSNLSGANLAYAIFSHSNLSGIYGSNIAFAATNLLYCDLTNADLSEAVFGMGTHCTGVNFTNVNFEGQHFLTDTFFNSTFTGANFSGADLNGCYLSNCNLTAQQLYSTANYQNKKFEGIQLETMDMTGWNFSGQNLYNVWIINCQITGADFSGAKIDWSLFCNSNLSKEQFYSTASYQEKDLKGVQLHDQDMTGWSFKDQNLYSVWFWNVDLTDADFSGACVEFTLFDDSAITKEQLYSTASYQAKNLSGLGLCGFNLSGWNFSHQNMSNAGFGNSNLTNADFSGASIAGASFDGSNLTPEQLYSTASYQNKDIHGLNLNNMDLTGWDFSGQNLSGSYFTSTVLTNTDFHGANLMKSNFDNDTFMGTSFIGADMRDAYIYPFTENLASANTINMIWADGTVHGLDLSGGGKLVVRNYVCEEHHLDPIAVKVQNAMTMGGDGVLDLVFDGNPWNSTISFDAGIDVTLGGTLTLDYAAGTDVLAQIGKAYKAFDWFGVASTGLFTVESTYSWDLSHLYSTGEVTMYAPCVADTKWTGEVSGLWNDAANWSHGVPMTDAVVEFDAASPTYQPIQQNEVSALNLKGIVFAPEAGEYLLIGATIQLSGDSPVVINASSADQYIGNALTFTKDTFVAVTGSGKLLLGGELDGSGGLRKRGAGTLILANVASYTGTTTIEEGCLALDETGDIDHSVIVNDGLLEIMKGMHTLVSVTGEGDVVVESGAVLAVGEYASGNITVADGGGVVFGTPYAAGPSSEAPLEAIPPVPEPSLWGLVLLGLLWLGMSRRKREYKR